MTAINERAELVEFRQTDAAIAMMRDAYMPLRVAGLDDKAGLKAVHEARMEVKGKRVAVEKKRKELKADALEYGQAVDAEARRLTGLLLPIETHLENEEGIVQRERDRLAKIEEDKKRAVLQSRLDAFTECGALINPADVALMTEDQYYVRLEAEQAKAQARIEAAEEQKRVAAEQALERDRLAEIQREQDERERKLREDQARIDAAAAEAKRRADLEQARIEGAERARIEEAERLARERVEADERKAAEAAAAAREEAAKPYRAKLLELADAIDGHAIPEGPFNSEVASTLKHAASMIRLTANRRMP